MISKGNQHDFTKGKKRQKKVDCRLMIHEIKMLFQKGPIVTLPKNLCKNASERQKSTFTYLTIQEKKYFAQNLTTIPISLLHSETLYWDHFITSNS